MTLEVTMGTRGPVPKKESQRRRSTPADKPVEHVVAARVVAIPEPDEDCWHPVALAWYLSLEPSGQSRFYEPSDWATAYLIAESISRDLSPQVVGITETGEVVRDVIPLKGASLSAYLRAMAVLMVTEGDRRRLQLELERPQPVDADAERAKGTVTDIRSRLEKSG